MTIPNPRSSFRHPPKPFRPARPSRFKPLRPASSHVPGCRSSSHPRIHGLHPSDCRSNSSGGRWTFARIELRARAVRSQQVDGPGAPVPSFSAWRQIERPLEPDDPSGMRLQSRYTLIDTLYRMGLVAIKREARRIAGRLLSTPEKPCLLS